MDPLDDPALITARSPWQMLLWPLVILGCLFIGASVFYAGYHLGHEVGWKAGYDYGRPAPNYDPSKQ